jgi:hypothetical protein
MVQSTTFVRPSKSRGRIERTILPRSVPGDNCDWDLDEDLSQSPPSTEVANDCLDPAENSKPLLNGWWIPRWVTGAVKGDVEAAYGLAETLRLFDYAHYERYNRKGKRIREPGEPSGACPRARVATADYRWWISKYTDWGRRLGLTRNGAKGVLRRLYKTYNLIHIGELDGSIYVRPLTLALNAAFNRHGLEGLRAIAEPKWWPADRPSKAEIEIWREEHGDQLVDFTGLQILPGWTESTTR